MGFCMLPLVILNILGVWCSSGLAWNLHNQIFTEKIQTKKYYFFMEKFDFQNLGSDLFLEHLRFLQRGFHYRRDRPIMETPL